MYILLILHYSATIKIELKLKQTENEL